MGLFSLFGQKSKVWKCCRSMRSNDIPQFFTIIPLTSWDSSPFSSTIKGPKRGVGGGGGGGGQIFLLWSPESDDFRCLVSWVFYHIWSPKWTGYGALIFFSWSPGTPYSLGRSPGALNLFGTLTINLCLKQCHNLTTSMQIMFLWSGLLLVQGHYWLDKEPVGSDNFYVYIFFPASSLKSEKQNLLVIFCFKFINMCN